MHREMKMPGWLARISVVALLAVAAGLLSMADPPGASESGPDCFYGVGPPYGAGADGPISFSSVSGTQMVMAL